MSHGGGIRSPTLHVLPPPHVLPQRARHADDRLRFAAAQGRAADVFSWHTWVRDPLRVLDVCAAGSMTGRCEARAPGRRRIISTRAPRVSDFGSRNGPASRRARASHAFLSEKIFSVRPAVRSRICSRRTPAHGRKLPVIPKTAVCPSETLARSIYGHSIEVLLTLARPVSDPQKSERSAKRKPRAIGRARRTRHRLTVYEVLKAAASSVGPARV